MRSLVVKTMLAWGCRYMGMGLALGLFLPAFIGGPTPVLLILSPPLCGAIVGAAVGGAGGAYYGWAKSGTKTKSSKDDSSTERETPEGLSAHGRPLRKLTLVAACSLIGAPILGGLWFYETRVRPKMLVDAGVAMVDEVRLDEAIAAFRLAICLRPDYADAHSNLGRALIRQQRPSEAVAELREAIRLNPGDSSRVLAEHHRAERGDGPFSEASPPHPPFGHLLPDGEKGTVPAPAE